MATGTVNLSCARITRPDLATIDQIARIQLGVRRHGCELRLEQPCAELVALIELAGLSGVLRVQVHREAEEREQPRCVQEEGELPDPPA
jgi:ABC-type transporter Mla MlaB component